MGQLTQDDIAEEAKLRRDRIHAFMVQDPPVPLVTIAKMEGMHERACRQIVKSIEEEHGLNYMNESSKAPSDAMPYGLSPATARLRGRLGDHLHQLRERGNNHDRFGRNQVAPRVGLNNRQQLKAEERPFAHDWTLSQIERLARELGEDPREFLNKCLNT